MEHSIKDLIANIEFFTNRYCIINDICRHDARNIKAFVLGLPFENNYYAKGSSQATWYIRKNILTIDPYSALKQKPIALNNIYDLGDLNKLSNLNAIKALKHLNTPIVFLGGDHSITIETTKFIDFDVFLYFDAHYDAYDSFYGSKNTHASVAKRVYEHGKEVINIGAKVIGNEEDISFIKTFDEKLIKGKKVYVSIDLDVFDKAMGVNTPEIGGITFKEFLDCLRKLKDTTITAFDIVEYNPLKDDYYTGLLAAKTFIELTSML